MNKRLWVLNPLLLATALPAFVAQADEENIIVSANRTHRTVAEMAQTTWVIEGQEIEQQVQGGKEFKDVLAQFFDIFFTQFHDDGSLRVESLQEGLAGNFACSRPRFDVARAGAGEDSGERESIKLRPCRWRHPVAYRAAW